MGIESGTELTVKLRLNDNPEHDIPIGTFTVDTISKPKSSSAIRKIVAYDNMKKFDVDVTAWYNSFNFTDKKISDFWLACVTL